MSWRRLGRMRILKFGKFQTKTKTKTKTRTKNWLLTDAYNFMLYLQLLNCYCCSCSCWYLLLLLGSRVLYTPARHSWPRCGRKGIKCCSVSFPQLLLLGIFVGCLTNSSSFLSLLFFTLYRHKSERTRDDGFSRCGCYTRCVVGRTG